MGLLEYCRIKTHTDALVVPRIYIGMSSGNSNEGGFPNSGTVQSSITSITGSVMQRTLTLLSCRPLALILLLKDRCLCDYGVLVGA